MGLSNATISPCNEDVIDAVAASFWVHDENLRTLRRAVIHTDDCPARNRGRDAAHAQWHGPFPSLTEARGASDQLTGIAMRGECRCVRRVVPKNTPVRALLNEPLFHQPAPVEEPPKKVHKAPKVAKAKTKSATEETKKSKKPIQRKRSRGVAYAVIGTAAMFAIIVTFFVFPALSVVEAGSEAANSPYRLANNIPLSLSQVTLQCSARLSAASLRLQNGHSELAQPMEKGSTASIPCFQSLGGSVPQTTGVTMQVIAEYGVLGLPHRKQTFNFVAARTSNGISRWVSKD